MMESNTPLIDVAVVGVQKAASTSLHRYMAMHPAFATHPQLEFAFFVRDEEYNKGYPSAFNHYFEKHTAAKKILVKNVGLIYWSKALERLHQHNPSMKVIAVLRNPVDRAYSAYHYASLMGVEDQPTFEAALDAGLERFTNPIDRGLVDYTGRGHYAEQLRNIYRLFPKENVLVVFQDDLKNDPQRVLQQCFQLCSVEDSFVPDFSIRFNEAGRSKNPGIMRMIKRNRGVRKIVGMFLPKRLRSKMMSKAENVNREKMMLPTMLPQTRERLVMYFRPMNDELSKMIGRDLSEWNR